jgi:hypothetical protein
MDGASLVVSTTCVAASTPVAVATIRGIRKFSGSQFVICPETAAEAIVKVKVVRAVANQLTGRGDPPLRSCSRWPEKKGCEQACAAQIAGSKGGCRTRSALSSTPVPSHVWTAEAFVGAPSGLSRASNNNRRSLDARTGSASRRLS